MTRWLVRDGEVVLSLQGGLGNQLFQWAFARSIQASGRSVLFDRVRLRGDRPYALGDLVPADNRLALPTGASLALAERVGLINKTSRLRKVKQIRSGLDPSVLDGLASTSYLLGYFQSPHYFRDVADQVRLAVRDHVAALLTDVGRGLAEQFRSDRTSVAVHVRRGDYLSDPSAAQRHGMLDRAYYDQALEQMNSLGLTRRVWFSDDPEWVRAELAGAGDVICPANATSADGGEIALMAACSARVVANSSFSWWGGWLGAPSTASHPVIAPRIWFAGGHSDAADLIPSDWLRL